MAVSATDRFGLNETDWETLLDRICNGRCTPFIGAGACYPKIPLGGAIAEKWANDYNYPFTARHEKTNLVHVAQFLAIKNGGDNVRPKEIILRDNFKKLDYPDFSSHSETHGILADLPLPLYITTNYDDFVAKALKAHGKNPQVALCQWNSALRTDETIFDKDDFEPDPQKPIIFHLHGHKEKEHSLVLTEEDYVSFLVQLSKGSKLIPPYIQECLAQNTILFIGYSLRDINFRVLFRSILNTVDKANRRNSLTLQFPEADYTDSIKEYLKEYFGDLKINVAWGAAEEFTLELYRRWKGYASVK